MVGIMRQARVVQPRSEMLGPAAVALIEQQDAEAGTKSLCREAAHVMRAAGSLEPVERQQHRV